MLDLITFPLRKRGPARAAAPAREARWSEHRWRRGHRGRAHPDRPRSGRLNLPPPRAARARRARRGCRGAARPSLGRGGARQAPGGPAGPETRAPAPLSHSASRGAGAARHGHAQATAPTRRRPPVPRLCPPRAPPSAPRPDPPRVTGATYLGAGRPQGTPRLPGPAANCPRACALQASGPDPGPEKKTKSPAAPGGRPGKCKWRALAKALLTRLSPPWQGYSGCVF